MPMKLSTQPPTKNKKRMWDKKNKKNHSGKKKKEQLPLLSHAHNEMQVYAILWNKQKLCA